MLRRARVLTISTLVLLAVGIGGMTALIRLRKPPERQSIEERAKLVRVMTVQQQDLPLLLEGFGTVRAKTEWQVSQPVVAMSVIPFGLIGALAGHLLMGVDLTMMSLFGLVALSGVVVNDSLVLLNFVNRSRAQGMPIVPAIMAGGQARFRAIMLTTLTTVAGLLPILLEKSFQAQFLVPMAISISFGLMGATLLVLILVPALYLLVHDLRRLLHGLWHGSWILPDEPSIEDKEAVQSSSMMGAGDVANAA
jgi:hypothetical protein